MSRESLSADRIPQSIRQRIRAQLPADVARQFDELMAWEDEIVQALNVASWAADRLSGALEELLDVAERIRGGDTKLDPERWYAARDFARVVLKDKP